MMPARRTGMIAHTQPRRIAASSVAKRIAEELKTNLGDVVGYKVRFTDKTHSGATIKLMTDGILLAETQTDPLLRAYDTVIIDEAHERSINIDFLLGYLKRLLTKRADLKMIVTSATIDAERFAQHFADENGKAAPIFNISGRTYPVEIRWRPLDDVDEADDRTMLEAIENAVSELEMAGRGDILVFLPGEREIPRDRRVSPKDPRGQSRNPSAFRAAFRVGPGKGLQAFGTSPHRARDERRRNLDYGARHPLCGRYGPRARQALLVS